MKTEALLLYSCLAMALLSLLGQIIMMIGQRNGNLTSNLRLSNDLPVWIKKLPLNTWMESNDQKLSGWFAGCTTHNEILLKVDLEATITLSQDRILSEVWMVAPYPHIRLFTQAIKCETVSLEDLTTFFEQEASVLQRPKYSIQIKQDPSSSLSNWHIQAWILQSQWLEFQEKWILLNKLPVNFNPLTRTDYTISV